MGVGNLPAVTVRSETSTCDEGILDRRTLGETRTEETRDLFDQSFGSQEGVVLFRELLDELFVLVEPEYIIIIMKFVAKNDWLGQAPTSSNHQQTCTRAQSAWHDRYRQHRQGCRWTCEDEER